MSQAWQPITDYETDPEELSSKELRALSGVWIDYRDVLGDSQSVSEFTERLKREWAVETGLIERLYTLDRGITELIIDQGVHAALIPHSAEGKSPTHIAAMIGDQEAAIESVFAFVKGDRQLSTSYIKELHHLFTREQETTEARDQFGQRTQVPLIHGDYKKQPNNPTRPDGSVYYYCPPEHVAAQMESLVKLHLDHNGVAPEVEAAWLHHRFAQIHPFQDGNGRIARALATMVFVKAKWLPLVVRDVDRKEYIDALESADNGDLKGLVSFFSRLQKREFIRVIGIAHETEKATHVGARIKSIKQRLAQRRGHLEQEWQAAISIVEKLRNLAEERLNEVAKSLYEAAKDYPELKFFVDGDENEGHRSHYFHREIVSTAKKLDYYANTGHFRSWTRLRLGIEGGNRGNILIAFHCIGHEFKGVLACSGTWFIRALTDDGSYETGGETELSDEVFQINYKDSLEDVQIRFKTWLEQVIGRGLALWESAI